MVDRAVSGAIDSGLVSVHLEAKSIISKHARSASLIEESLQRCVHPLVHDSNEHVPFPGTRSAPSQVQATSDPPSPKVPLSSPLSEADCRQPRGGGEREEKGGD